MKINTLGSCVVETKYNVEYSSSEIKKPEKAAIHGLSRVYPSSYPIIIAIESFVIIIGSILPYGHPAVNL